MDSFLNTWRVHTNNHIESFHRVLKYTRMEKRKARVDELLQLLRASVSNHYKRIIQFPDLGRVREILAKRVIDAKSIYIDKGFVISDEHQVGRFVVNSKTHSEIKYVVNLVPPDGPTCTCPTRSALQCVHILASAIMFPKSLDHGLDPRMPRYIESQNTGVGSDVDEPEDVKREGKLIL